MGDDCLGICFEYLIRLTSHMRRFPEPQNFFAAALQNWDLRSSKECQRQNIGFVAPGFGASKFLPPLWSIVNCRKLTIYD